MFNGRFFTKVETLEDLKRQYRTLAMANHPDRGGDAEAMKLINSEYDAAFKKVKDIFKNAKGETYTKENTEAASEFKDIIEKLIHMVGVEIEIIGCFIWLSGETKPHKDNIKALGFRWHSTKKMWYKAPDGYKKRSRKAYSMDDIRQMYGTSGTFTGKANEDKLIEAGA